MTQILLSEPVTDKAVDYAPINVFTIDYERYSPLLLEVLSVMSFRSEVRKRGAISEEYNIPKLTNILSKGGYSEREIGDGLARAFRHDNRLMYSTVADIQKISRMGVEGYKQKDSVFLSWAGYRYATQLVRNPSYIQWGLLRVPEVVRMCGLSTKDLGSIGAVDGNPTLDDDIEEHLHEERLSTSMRNLKRIIVHVASWRVNHRIEFFPGEINNNRELVELSFRHSLPEIEIMMSALPTICGILAYRASRRRGGAEGAVLFRDVRSEFLSEASEILRSACGVCEYDFPTWQRLLRELKSL